LEERYNYNCLTSRMPVSDEQTDAQDKRFLVSALLVFVAKGDGNISDIESGRMIDLLADRLQLSNAEALESLSTVLNAMQDEDDIARRLRAIGTRLTDRQKRELFTMMLDVAAVDEVRDEGETQAINMGSRILGMSEDLIREACRDFFGRY